jgi:hypothetical protein
MILPPAMHYIEQRNWVWFWCLTPLSKIFQLHIGGGNRSHHLSPATDKLYHIMLYRVNFGMNRIRTHSISDNKTALLWYYFRKLLSSIRIHNNYLLHKHSSILLKFSLLIACAKIESLIN